VVGDGLRVMLLMMGEAATEGVLELGGETVRVTDGVSEIVLVEDGAAVTDLERVGVAVGVRVLELGGLAVTDAAGVLLLVGVPVMDFEGVALIEAARELLAAALSEGV